MLLHGASCRCSRARSTRRSSSTWDWSNFSDALSRLRRPSSCARSSTPGIATLLCLLIAYPLAYAIAFKAGRWQNADAVRGDRAVLHHLPDPDDRLEDDPLRRRARSSSVLQTLGLVADDGRVLATPAAVIAGLTYNFLPFMILPIYASLERIDTRLIEAGKDLYASPRTTFLQGDAAALGAGDHRRHAAHLHPGGRRLRQRHLPRRHRTRR